MRCTTCSRNPTRNPTYDAVASLPPESQRELLRAGTNLEKLWAAWALGLSVGAAALPDLRGAAAEAPVSGLRRHLAVVLAGLGERDVVETLALCDPDDLVRVTAGEVLVRTARPEHAGTQTFVRVLDRLLRDPSAPVRLAVLGEVLRRAAVGQLPPMALDDLARHAADPAVDVRRMALEAIAAAPPDEAALVILEQRLTLESDRDLRRWLAERLVAAGHASAVLEQVGTSGDGGEWDEDLLRVLVEGQQRFRWDPLAHLARLERPAVDAHLAALVRPDDTAALPWVVACALRSERWPNPRGRTEWDTYQVVQEAGRAASGLLDSLLPLACHERLTGPQQEACGALATALEGGLAQAEEYARLETEDLVAHGQPAHEQALREIEELRESDWYQRQVWRINELRRLATSNRQ